MWGVAVVVVVPRGVSWLQLLRHVGCYSRGCCAMWGVTVVIVVPYRCCLCYLCAVCGVTLRLLCHMWCRVAVFAPRVVLQSRSLCHVGCHGRSCCTMCSATVVALCGVSWSLCCVGCCGCSVVVAAFVLHAVLWSWEGEVGYVSIGKGGGRWKVGVLRSEVEKKKLHTISE